MKRGRFKKHDTLLDSGLVNLDPAFSYKDYPKYKGKEHVKGVGKIVVEHSNTRYTTQGKEAYQ